MARRADVIRRNRSKRDVGGTHRSPPPRRTSRTHRRRRKRRHRPVPLDRRLNPAISAMPYHLNPWLHEPANYVNEKRGRVLQIDDNETLQLLALSDDLGSGPDRAGRQIVNSIG